MKPKYIQMSASTSRTETKRRINRSALVAQVLFKNKDRKMTAQEVYDEIIDSGVDIGMQDVCNRLMDLSGNDKNKKKHLQRDILIRTGKSGTGDKKNSYLYQWNPKGTYDCRPVAMGNVKVDNVSKAVFIDTPVHQAQATFGHHGFSLV